MTHSADVSVQSAKSGGLRQIESHTAIRGCAALFVLGYHLQFGVNYRLPFEQATQFFQRSYLFVDLFFILSGFIISYVNDADRSSRFTMNEFKRFIRGRFMRLYPLHLFCLAYLAAFCFLASLLFLITGVRAPPTWQANSLEILGAQTLLLNAYIPLPIGWNIASWSISAEIGAYLIFPMLVTLYAFRPRLAAAFLVLAPLIFYLAIGLSGRSLDITIGFGWARCLAGFMLGMATFYARRTVASLSSWQLSALQMAASLVIGVALCLALPDPFIIPAFVILVATTWTDRGIVPAFLRRGPWVWTGQISYSVYLNHVPLIAVLNFAWSHLHIADQLSPADGRLCWIIIVLATTLLVSHCTYNYVERPARQWLSRRWLDRRASPIEASPAAP